MNMNNFDIPKYLSDHGVKPSYQRIKILDFFVNNKIHPTVNDIYEEIITEIPTLSKTTVYNTLKLFVENKIIKEILIEENEVRYDWAECDHGHFKCEVCGKVYDVPFKFDTGNYPLLADSVVKEKHIYFKGICSSCNEKAQN